MDSFYQTLEQLGIAYELYDHSPFYTCEESQEWYEEHFDSSSGESKNLLLRDKKGATHYLVVVESSKQLDLKNLAKTLGESKLSFASEERLMKYLGVKPGAVSVLALTHPGAKEVQVIFDKELLAFEKLHYHPPGRNDQTLVISVPDLKRFIEFAGNPFQEIDF